ncbi:MAG: ATP-dependent helicase [Caldilineales bacterium]|nr:ATP-dependent helicase [Caldilineales bacterium]MDW8317183.1 ATP-dependent helicase [Anaerolineae bacterium]
MSTDLPPAITSRHRLRPGQLEVLAYAGGRLGVSAVPGSGKTFTLALLAAKIVLSGWLQPDQEVLVVTLVNSAVDNFAQRIAGILKREGLLPTFGYRVRTLHGLAHDIVRERPALVGLADDFQIVDERVAQEILDDLALAWLQGHPDALDDYLDYGLDPKRLDWVRRDKLPDLVREIAASAVRYAKDLELTPEALRQRLEAADQPLPLARLVAEVYADYQAALAYRGAVDFDDLIRLALAALERDPALLERLQRRWPYVLEDEAQDSSRLQEQILRKLVGPAGNWVRVGDPNQAIYETFTTASPQFLLRFLEEEGVQRRELPTSGRSAQPIIGLANGLISWVRSAHPRPEARDALALPYIQAVEPDDPQPNPPAERATVRLVLNKLSPEMELKRVADSLERWLPEHPDQTVAVLAPRNDRGAQVVDELRRRKLAVVDSLLRSTASTRQAAGALANVLVHLAEPQSARRLAEVYRVWRRAEREDEEAWDAVEAMAKRLRGLPQVEAFLWPRPYHDWLAEQADLDEAAREDLAQFRDLVQRWHGATLLPVDQLVLTLAQDLFTAPSDLALAYKLAGLLRQAADAHPDWRLPQLADELRQIARNERRFLGFSEDDLGFDPDRYKGKVVVGTVHKAKGLEWDRVYLMSVNAYDFPAGEPSDQYISERWFLRGRLNLEAEALAQIRMAGGLAAFYSEGEATLAARLDYVRERLRLLYVGITRARRDLIITWNSGRNGQVGPALALVALAEMFPDSGSAAGGA